MNSTDKPGATLDAALEATFPASDPVSIASAAQDPHASEAPILVYRVVAADRVASAFSIGQSSAGRWTRAGAPVIYASGSAAGALLEFLAHLEGRAPDELRLVVAALPAAHLAVVQDLPEQWTQRPYRADVQAIGDRWWRSAGSLALEVPSALCGRTRNVLINTEHPAMTALGRLSEDTLPLDPRLRY